MALAVGHEVSLRLQTPSIGGFPVPPVIGIITAQVGNAQFVKWENGLADTIDQPAADPAVLDRIEAPTANGVALIGRYVQFTNASGGQQSAEFRGIVVRVYQRDPRDADVAGNIVEFVVVRTDRGFYFEVPITAVSVVADR